MFQEYIRAVKVIFSDYSEKTSWTDPNSRGWRGCCLRWGLRLGKVTFGESEQIRIQPCGGFKEVQQRMGTEPKSNDSEPCE